MERCNTHGLNALHSRSMHEESLIVILPLSTSALLFEYALTLHMHHLSKDDACAMRLNSKTPHHNARLICVISVTSLSILKIINPELRRS